MANMANSAGNAEEEMEIIRDSAEYLYNQLKETFTSIAQHAVDRDDLKNLIKLGTSLLEIVDGIVSGIGAIPALLTVIFGAVAASKKQLASGNLFTYNPATGNKSFLGATIGKGWMDRLRENKTIVKQITQEYKSGAVSCNTYERAMRSSSVAVQEYAKAARAGVDVTEKQNAALTACSLKAKLLEVGFRALNFAMSAIATVAVSMAISAVIKAIDDSIHAVEKSFEKLKNLEDEAESIESDLKSIADELKTTKLRMAELEEMPKLTIMQEEELEKLKETNDELERQQRIRENEERANEIEKSKEAENLYKNMFPYRVYPTSVLTEQDAYNRYKSRLERYKDLQKEIEDLKNSDEYELNSKKYDEEINKKQQQIRELEKEIGELYVKWNEIAINL